MYRLIRLTAMLALALGCGPTAPSGDGGALDDALFEGEDADGDGISDVFEDASESVDTDGDGVPDFRDPDSDGDGRPDSEERGSGGNTSPPEDADGDGIPNFRDLDSDGNGLSDTEDSSADTDGNGAPDYRDIDDDGDQISDIVELGGDPRMPEDFDDDGLPDFQDIDSDNDRIGDLFEGSFDTDSDDALDRQDLDSDSDGFSDMEEGGDGNPMTPPPDTDRDGIADFRDPDSDGDGLSDADERTRGTRRDDADSDGDGVTDLIEIFACDGNASCAGDALDPESSPRTRGDFVFSIPFNAPAGPARDTLDFSTDIRVADIYFVIDTTASMEQEIADVQSSLSLPGTGIIDSIRATIPEAEFGVGEFRDTNTGAFMELFVFRNRQNITPSATMTQAAVNMLGAGGGGDLPEAGIPAIFSAITGIGMQSAPPAYPDAPPCPDGRFGYPCFRPEAVPILVVIMDNNFHNGPGNSFPTDYTDTTGQPINYARTVAALNAANARVVGVAVQPPGDQPVEFPALLDLQEIAQDTGAIDVNGQALVSTVPVRGSGVSAAVIDQVQTLVGSAVFDITVGFVDDASDSVDTNDFVAGFEANIGGDASRGCAPRPAIDANGDGILETFEGVGGDRVCFDILSRMNDSVEPTSEPQVFEATVNVIGDGFTVLDRRRVFFLVPPDILISDILI